MAKRRALTNTPTPSRDLGARLRGHDVTGWLDTVEEPRYERQKAGKTEETACASWS